MPFIHHKQKLLVAGTDMDERSAQIFHSKRVQNLAVSKEPWDLSEVITDKHRINKNIPGLGPQKMYCSQVRSAAEMACLSRMTCS